MDVNRKRLVSGAYGIIQYKVFVRYLIEWTFPVKCLMNSDFSVLNFIGNNSLQASDSSKFFRLFKVFFLFSQRCSRHIHFKIRSWFRYQTIHQVSTDCKWKKCKAFQNFNISCFITYDSLENKAWMVKVFLTADIAVGMAPLAVKFAYQSFKYLVLNYQVDFFMNRTPYYRNLVS